MPSSRSPPCLRTCFPLGQDLSLTAWHLPSTNSQDSPTSPSDFTSHFLRQGLPCPLAPGPGPAPYLYFTGAITGLFLPLHFTPLGQRPCLRSFNSNVLHRPGTQYVLNKYLLKRGDDNLCPTVQCTGFAEKACFMLRSPLMKNKTNLPIAILNPSVFLIE